MGPADMETIAGAIARVLEAGEDAAALDETRRTVAELCAAYPLV
jgi:glycine/serine hydroxymethyltransferase